MFSGPVDRHRRGMGSAGSGAVTSATATLSSYYPCRKVRRSNARPALPMCNSVCEAALQDTMRVLACLQANRPKIGAGCNRVHGH